METVAYLVGHVGRRFAGSSGEHEAAHYLAAEFKRLGLNVRIERFKFMGWELHEIPRLKILKPEVTELPCAPYIYSSSTPEGGLEGKLEFRGPEEPSSAKEALKYVLFDDQS